MKQIFKFSILFFVMIQSSTVYSQVYQNSVYKGVNITAAYSPAIFSSPNLVAGSSVLHGASIKFNYGISENFGVLIKYHRLLSSTIKGKEIGYFIFTETSSHELTQYGLRYNLLSPQSKFRAAIEGTIGTINTKFDLFDDKSNNRYKLNTKGFGYSFGLILDYFPKPFLSVETSGAYHIGKYKESEYFGSLYSENTSYSIIQLSLGLAYHFSGR